MTATFLMSWRVIVLCAESLAQLTGDAEVEPPACVLAFRPSAEPLVVSFQPAGPKYLVVDQSTNTIVAYDSTQNGYGTLAGKHRG